LTLFLIGFLVARRVEGNGVINTTVTEAGKAK